MTLLGLAVGVIRGGAAMMAHLARAMGEASWTEILAVGTLLWIGAAVLVLMVFHWAVTAGRKGWQ